MNIMLMIVGIISIFCSIGIIIDSCLIRKRLMIAERNAQINVSANGRNNNNMVSEADNNGESDDDYDDEDESEDDVD